MRSVHGGESVDMSVCRRRVCCVRVRFVTRGPCLHDGVGVDSTGGVGEYACCAVSLEHRVRVLCPAAVVVSVDVGGVMMACV